jgi:hypothetical protein
MKLLIYTPRITSRIRYITDYIFRDYLLFYCVLTDSESEFQASDSLKLSYGKCPLANELFVGQHPLLLENGIEPQEIDLLEYDGMPAFFAVDAQGSPFPFDLFAAAFYLITRYEEYLPYTPDKFGRYSARNALAIKAGFLDKPLVNIWAKQLLSELQLRYPGVEFPCRQFDYLPTYDIDQPYAFRYRGVLFNCKEILTSITQKHFAEAKTKFLMMTRFRKDQYDTYGFQFALQQQFGFRACYFVLCALHKNQYEHALACNSRHVKRLVQRMQTYGQLGIHLSLASGTDATKTRKEIEQLAVLAKETIIRSRQHYLVLKMPETYRTLVDRGISEDYTMGYASRPGFRASACTPFKWFDLSRNESTPLTVYPFAYMDGTLNHSMKLNKADAERLIRKLTDQVKSVDGLLVSVWHNSSLCNSGKWSGWRSMYKHSIEYADSLCALPEYVKSL